METEYAPQTIVALYTTLADAEHTLHDLEDAGVPYPATRLGTHTPADVDCADIAERTALAGITLPEHFWSVASGAGCAGKRPCCRVAAPARAVGGEYAARAGSTGRGDPDRGALAWRHYVFETERSDRLGRRDAGTTGTTGVISSGAFADGAKVEGNPPATGVPASDQRPSDEHRQPSSDTMRPQISTDRSRPETELKQ